MPLALRQALGALPALADAGARLLCHPAVTALQAQGAAVLALLGLGWLLAGVARLGELRRREQGGDADAACSAPAKAWPGVSVVLPVKGCKPHGPCNWASQLAQAYDGPLEFLFVADSKADPALAAVSQLAARHPGARVRALVAGHASRSSQKIHNLQAGIRAADGSHEFVLCCDDDVCLHPGSLRESVAALQQQPDAFMATGYPFDIPPQGSDLRTHCLASYHLPLLIAFSLSARTHFVWGGFMLFRLRQLRAGGGGILQAWSEGGYSDDLTAAARCSEAGLPVLCPAFAVFPQWLEGRCSWRRCWNYLRRQIFVMDTYASVTNRRINHSFMLLHSYLSLAFVLPATTVALRLALWALQLLLLPTQAVWAGPGSSWAWLTRFGGAGCTANSLSVLAFMGSLAAAAASLRWMSGVLLRLFGRLSPSAEPLAASSFQWGKVWLGLYVNNWLIPACMLYTWLTTSVVWSGVRYTRRAGRIVAIRRLDAGASDPSTA